MAELMRTWMTRWLTLREHRASSWSTSTASHRTGGWWWRYSLYWWCFSWSSYSSSLDSFCTISLLMLCVDCCYAKYSLIFAHTTIPCTQFSPRMISNRSPFCGHVNWDSARTDLLLLTPWVAMFPQHVWCIISGPNQTVIGDSNVSESLLIIVGSPLLVCVIYFLIVSVVSAASVSVILVIFSQ